MGKTDSGASEETLYLKMRSAAPSLQALSRAMTSSNTWQVLRSKFFSNIFTKTKNTTFPIQMAGNCELLIRTQTPGIQEVGAYLAKSSGVLQNYSFQILLHLVNAQKNILHKQRQRKYPTPPGSDGGKKTSTVITMQPSPWNASANVVSLLDSADNGLALLSIVFQTFLGAD